jgi:alkylated DNA repair dioxygenase AlkB
MTLPGLEQFARPKSPVKVIKGFLPFEQRLPLFRALESGRWDILKTRWGVANKRKTVTYYEGDESAANAYMNKFGDKGIHAIPYTQAPPELNAVREMLRQRCGLGLSLCYINYYADETVQIGWHQDREERGSKYPLLMVTLGGTRTFSTWKIKNSEQPKPEWEEETASGDLVEMPVGFHDDYKHAVLPQKHFAAARISLTFRNPDLSSSGPWAPKHSRIYQPGFLSPDESKALFDACEQLPRKRGKTHWGVDKRHLIGQSFSDVESNRLAYVTADLHAKPIAEAPQPVQNMISKLTQLAGRTVNYAFLVIYDNKQDHMNWHQHKEDKGHDTPVFIVSVGAERTFGVREKGKPGTTFKFLAEEGSLITLPTEYNDTHEHAVLVDTTPKGIRYAFNCKCIDEIYLAPRVWDCHAGKNYPKDAIYVGCRVRNMKGDVIREGTIFGNATNPLVSHYGWLRTEKDFRTYAIKKLEDSAFRQQAEQLRGKHLLCWCVQDGPKRAEFCHARIWLDLINNMPVDC